MMEQYEDMEIKEVVKKYPQLANILKEYDILCDNCDGKCLMRSITEEHNLSMKEEMELVSKISEIIPE